MHHSALLFALALTLLAATALSAAPAKPSKVEIERGFLSRTISVGGKDMKDVVYVPPAYDPAKPMPTIVFLNGAGECGTDGWRQVYHFGGAIMLDMAKWPFLILFPQKQDVKTNWEDEEPMVMAILKKARESLTYTPPACISRASRRADTAHGQSPPSTPTCSRQSLRFADGLMRT